MVKRPYDLRPGTRAATAASVRAAKRRRIDAATDAGTAAPVSPGSAEEPAIADLLEARKSEAALARFVAGKGSARARQNARTGAEDSIAGLRRYLGADFRGAVGREAAFPRAVPRNDLRIASWNSTGLTEGRLRRFLGHCDGAKGGAMDLVLMQETNAGLVDRLVESGDPVHGYRAVGRTLQGGSGGPYAVFCRDDGAVTRVRTWGLISYPDREMLRKLPLADIARSDLVADNSPQSVVRPPQLLTVEAGDHKALDLYNCHLPASRHVSPSSLRLCSATCREFGTREMRDGKVADRDAIQVLVGDVNQSRDEVRANLPREAAVVSRRGEDLCHVVMMPADGAALKPLAVDAFTDYAKAAGDGDHGPLAAVLEFAAKLY
ncbi:MAG: hypothetical protein H6906_09940 [Hyphomicrobiales bacterium]|nr:hypothetical protein [Hyphomicrobiales bacterium]